MLRNKDKHVECQLLLPTEQELYVSGRGIIDTNCMGIARRQEDRKAAQIDAGFLKGFLVLLLGTQLPAEFSAHQTSLIHVTSVCKDKRIKNKDKHVECQLLLPTEQELYVSGRGIIDTNCMGIARRQEF
ncbi:hypothetical protein DPMN_158982 [Dreissena polymorpha]|uniref:Uncharacterized protein n=1 Tax=Dreissena polymorpha TaxID=45954 RepID=A0A9D4ENI1_DREPO|nr:hypothetical protein DPMN_158982 [Dreissena polymorpha]